MEKDKKNRFPFGVNLKVIKEGSEQCKHIYHASLRSREKKCMKCPLVVKEV